jgi:hypothetical protein
MAPAWRLWTIVAASAWLWAMALASFPLRPLGCEAGQLCDIHVFPVCDAAPNSDGRCEPAPVPVHPGAALVHLLAAHPLSTVVLVALANDPSASGPRSLQASAMHLRYQAAVAARMLRHSPEIVVAVVPTRSSRVLSSQLAACGLESWTDLVHSQKQPHLALARTLRLSGGVKTLNARGGAWAVFPGGLAERFDLHERAFLSPSPGAAPEAAPAARTLVKDPFRVSTGSSRRPDAGLVKAWSRELASRAHSGCAVSSSRLSQVGASLPLPSSLSFHGDGTGIATVAVAHAASLAHVQVRPGSAQLHSLPPARWSQPEGTDMKASHLLGVLRASAQRPSFHVLALCHDPTDRASLQLLQLTERVAVAIGATPFGQHMQTGSVHLVRIDASSARQSVRGSAKATDNAALETSTIARVRRPAREEQPGGWMDWIADLIGFQRNVSTPASPEVPEHEALHQLGCRADSLPHFRYFGSASEFVVSPGEGAFGSSSEAMKLVNRVNALAARVQQGDGEIEPVRVPSGLRLVDPVGRLPKGLPLPWLDLSLGEASCFPTEWASPEPSSPSRSRLRRNHTSDTPAALEWTGHDARSAPFSIVPPPAPMECAQSLTSRAEHTMLAFSGGAVRTREEIVGRDPVLDSIAAGFSHLPRHQMRARVEVLRGLLFRHSVSDMARSIMKGVAEEPAVRLSDQHARSSARFQGREVSGHTPPVEEALSEVLGGIKSHIGARDTRLRTPEQRAMASQYLEFMSAAVDSGQPEEWLERETQRRRERWLEEAHLCAPGQVRDHSMQAGLSDRVLKQHHRAALNVLESLTSDDRRLQLQDWSGQLESSTAVFAANGLLTLSPGESERKELADALEEVVRGRDEL